MNKDFFEKIKINVKNVIQKSVNRSSEFYKNFSEKVFPFIDRAVQKLAEWISEFYKFLSEKVFPFIDRAVQKLAEWISEFYKFLSEKVFPYIKSVILKFAVWVSEFFKNKVVPFVNKVISSIKEFIRLVKIDIRKDNKDYENFFADVFCGLKLYGMEAWYRIKILLRKMKILLGRFKEKSLPIAKRIYVSFPSYPKNVISHIKYLSYRRLIIYCSVFILLDIFFIWFSSYRILYAKHYWEVTQDKKFFIRPGKSLDEIINELKQNDILKSKLIFKIYVKLSGKEEKIISKRYLFTNGISNSELLNMLTDRNMVQMEKFTLIEGLGIKQIAKITETKLQLSGERFIRETENDSLINILGLKGKVNNLEGFLFPDTYYLPLNADEKELVNILFNEFRKKVLNDEISNEIKEKKNLLEVITLASIIQGETKLKDEMETISGVYHNRIIKKMKLEADPTIQYILPDGPKPKLKYSDLKIDSPYNTYKHFGLPPGPINNPGLYAIKAALNPENNNYLFFVATGNGGHKFSETYREHLKAVEEYKKNMEKKVEQ
jgi:UPF0755 protein